ncbi:Sugar transporter, major facilitator superfamily [Candidatus Koribacter versatilis Ellin345]|uniref:Sugar transporter, major facilitator superfamily n=1 Tax=Koribacter versatilis (strain Ellin345) TaxID=204669 RepID=Q1ITZ1_KORVE|nr:sugar porter family MFS transporter [Candidatus Koribacter versatilis]ABF39659.1 Sugar transporter, major facilitator superfamily [Candidatus Koribacter versatilis Ellin345]
MAINRHVVKSTFVSALGGLLFGFDTAVIAGTTHQLTEVFKLTPNALGITVSSALLGTVLGAITAGYPGQRIGRRDSLRIMAIFYMLSALGCALAWNWSSLLVFRVIGGLGIGGSSVLAPMYIAELSPPKWRGRLVGFFQVNIVIGILVAYLSNFVIGRMNFGAMEWRWMLGIAAAPAVLFFVMLFFIPRSPRWLAMKGRTAEALRVMRLTGTDNPEEELNGIVRSIHLERSTKSESLLQRKYLLPIFLAVSAGAFNQLTGINACLYYLNDIFAAAGASKYSAGMQSVLIGCTNLFFTLVAMTMIDKLGRKKLLLVGTTGVCIFLAIIGQIFHSGGHGGSLIWLLIGFMGFFAISQGAVIWVYISEVFPTRVRAQGQALGTSTLWITNALISWMFPVLAAKSSATPFFFFAAMMFIDVLIIAMIYPETSGVSLEQLEQKLGVVE